MGSYTTHLYDILQVLLTYYFKSWKRITPSLNPRTAYSNLEEMLALRCLGYSYTVLADRYGVPKETIRFLCRRFGLDQKNVETVFFREHSAPTVQPRVDYNEEIINEGKTYAQYLKEEEERKKWRKRTQGY